MNRRSASWLVVVCVGLGLIPGLAAGEEPKTDSLEVIKKNVQEKKAVILDVREQSEWDEGHLKGATLFSVTKIREGADPKTAAPDVAKPGMIVYCHCRAGKRAADAAELLRKKGYDARAIKEGYETLIKSGFEKAK
ncbi:MAG: rhodanese-like domain-containing protein [Pirellulales bacterium]|jgi:phage shock protein E